MKIKMNERYGLTNRGVEFIKNLDELDMKVLSLTNDIDIDEFFQGQDYVKLDIPDLCKSFRKACNNIYFSAVGNKIGYVLGKDLIHSIDDNVKRNLKLFEEFVEVK
jgi:hypothetical protein